MNGLTKNLQDQIVTTIIRHKPVDKIVLYGSRSRNEYDKTSDIDLAIFSELWTSTDINLVLDQLEEKIPTVLRFDLLLFQTINKKLLKDEIERGVVLYCKQSGFEICP